MRLISLGGILLFCYPGFAHEIAIPISNTDSLDGSSIIIAGNLLFFSVLYFRGWKKHRLRFPQEKNRSLRQLIFFASAQLTLLVALLSSLERWAENLAWVHMLQHILLMMVAPPLLAMSSVKYIFQWSLPAKIWRQLWLLRRKFQALLIHLENSAFILFSYAFILWLWHLPSFYEQALKGVFVHNLQHLSFFASSYWFWSILLDPFSKRPVQPGLALFYIFVTSIHTMILGVLMALSPRVWYGIYEVRAPRLGWDPLIDQQLAGIIMWMPAGVTYLVVAILLFKRVLQGE